MSLIIKNPDYNDLFARCEKNEIEILSKIEERKNIYVEETKIIKSNTVLLNNNLKTLIKETNDIFSLFQISEPSHIACGKSYIDLVKNLELYLSIVTDNNFIAFLIDNKIKLVKIIDDINKLLPDSEYLFYRAGGEYERKFKELNTEFRELNKIVYLEFIVKV
jgi:hypothetical protein